MQQRDLGFGVNLVPQAVHVHFDQIRKRIERFIPDVFGDRCAPHHAAGVARQKFHQRVFFGRERNAAAAARYGLRRGVH